MVLEQIVHVDWLERRPLFSMFLGFVYTLIASITAYIFFPDNISISMLFLVTLLIVPSLANLISYQEEIEKKEGIKHFFHNHKDIFEIYFFLSIGIFLTYLLMIVVFNSLGLDINMVLSEQIKAFGNGLTVDKVIKFSGGGFMQFLGIFTRNLEVAVIFFILSFFYGAGSIFLIVWNASIFSTFVALSLENLSKGVKYMFGLLGAFAIYLIPEIAGFLFAAIAGGVISKAIITEKFMSDDFRNVVKDATILFLLSIGFILVAALLETYVSVEIVKMLI